MKISRLLFQIALVVVLCAGVTFADSLELRNGRHLQGRYIGGTSTAIGFMTGTTVEYFATSDILVLIFDNSADSSGGGLLQRPMSGPDAGKDNAVRPIRAKKHSRSTAHVRRVSNVTLD